MNSNKVLVFDISGEYAHFRKFNTTTSPLTYSLPTRPALAGLLGAILGIRRETSPNVFPKGVVPVNEVFHPDKAHIGVRILNKIQKAKIGFNLLDTSKQGSSFFNIKNRTQIEFEFLKEVSFRIYLQHQEETIFKKIYQAIANKNHHFTPYLGLSQCTASIDLVGLFDGETIQQKGEHIPIVSAVNLSKLGGEHPIKFSSGSFTVDTLPNIMLRNRVVEEYAEILIERNANELFVNTESYTQVNNTQSQQIENILFL